MVSDQITYCDHGRCQQSHKDGEQGPLVWRQWDYRQHFPCGCLQAFEALILFEQALLSEGASLEDPAEFVRRVNSLLA